MHWITSCLKYVILYQSGLFLSDIVIEKSIEEYTAVMYKYFVAFN